MNERRFTTDDSRASHGKDSTPQSRQEIVALRDFRSDFENTMIAGTPLGRIGQPDDIDRVAVFLASDDSAWLSGERLTASGGYLRQGGSTH
jgi:NAD(P)-dependent dehydrogenase (short-subunit alcohol dehydrogenase family)